MMRFKFIIFFTLFGGIISFCSRCNKKELSFSNISYQGQFHDIKYVKDFKDNYYIVTDNNLNVYSKATIDSEILLKLKITSLVKLMKNVDNKEMNLNKWIYIDSGVRDYRRGQIEGWITSNNLITVKNFTKVETIRSCNIKGLLGDGSIEIDINQDGTFKLRKNDFYNKKFEKYSGELYRYKNIYYLKYEKSFYKDFLFMNDEGKLCTAWYFDKNNKDLACCE